MVGNHRQRHDFAGGLQCADHLAAFDHAVGAIGALVFGIAALAAALGSRRVRAADALSVHRLHAIRHVHVGHCRAGVSGSARRSGSTILVHSRNRRHARRKRQRDCDQDCKNGANDVQAFWYLQATIMKPRRFRSRHD